MNSKALFQELTSSITLDEDRSEIRSMVYLALEKLLGLTKTDIISEKPFALTPAIQAQLNDLVTRLNSHEPIQYITGECHFYGRTFAVNHHVLIPRPETEELVRTVLHFARNKKTRLRMLDIGTGSGCIPVTLALEVPTAEVLATDISEHALATAEANARSMGALVKYLRHDILNEPLPVKELDAIVSNPPYITDAEKKQMKQNVLAYEPHLALFVRDDDPLVFYKAICSSATQALTTGGLLAVEINERLGQDVALVFEQNSFTSIEVIKDLSGKARIVKGVK